MSIAFQDRKTSLPETFKGIALFTPGGDLIYCIDTEKRSQWHLHLCAAARDIWDLPELPHFLVPCYGATIDRWRDRASGRLQTAAEVSPLAWRYRGLLSAIFDCDPGNWQLAARSPQLCDPAILDTYRQQFPQLWEEWDVVARVDGQQSLSPAPEGYVFRLYTNGRSATAESILQGLYPLLDGLSAPYSLKAIDVRKHPERAEADRISAVPTLVRAWPLPVRRIVGERALSDEQLISSLLGQ